MLTCTAKGATILALVPSSGFVDASSSPGAFRYTIMNSAALRCWILLASPRHVAEELQDYPVLYLNQSQGRVCL